MNERPIRAYSVGSRLEHNKRKMRVDMLSSEHNQNQSSRVRAFSVGSRIKVNRELTHGNSNPLYLKKTSSQDVGDILSTLNNNITSGSSISTVSTNKSSKKSSSTPLLVNLSGSKNGGSVDPMDDLMEIDFTKKDDDSLSTDSNYEQKHISCDDLMEIDYPQYTQMGSAHRVPTITNTPSRSTQPMQITGRHSDRGGVDVGPTRSYLSVQQLEIQREHNGYIDMKPVGDNVTLNELLPHQQELKRPASLSSSPLRTPVVASISLHQQKNESNKNTYIEMRARNQLAQSNVTTSTASTATPTMTASSSLDDYLNMSPVSVRSISTSSQQRQSSHDGYMPMSWGNNKLSPSSNVRTNINNIINNNPSTNLLTVGSSDLNPQSSSSSTSSNEYINMSFKSSGGKSSTNTSSGCGSSTTSNSSTSSSSSCCPYDGNARMQSQPIAIKAKKQQLQQSSSSMSHQKSNKIYPPTHLSLNMIADVRATTVEPLASTRSESKDSGIATPTGQSAVIFPFSPNSPSSGIHKLPASDDNKLAKKWMEESGTQNSYHNFNHNYHTQF